MIAGLYIAFFTLLFDSVFIRKVRRLKVNLPTVLLWGLEFWKRCICTSPSAVYFFLFLLSGIPSSFKFDKNEGKF